MPPSLSLPNPLLAMASLPVLEETILFLLCAVLVSIVAKRLKIPYTIMLVAMGIVVGLIREFGHLFQGEGHFELTDQVILLIFLPPLLFEGAMNIRWEKLRKHSGVILALSFLGTFGSVFLIAAASKAIIGWEWEFALLLGVIVSPTDPVSVLAIFREQGAPKGLAVLVEGESLFNDGLSIVLYLLILEGIGLGWDTIEPGAKVLHLGWMFIGGCLVGTVLGVVGNRILGKLDDHLVEVLISVVLAYGSYLLAEHLHCSGVIAVVFAGLLFGNVGRTSAMSPTTLLTVNLSWEVFAFLANSLVFLAMGFVIEIDALIEQAVPILAIFSAMIAARTLLTYAIAGIDLSLRGAYPRSWLHVLNWGGLKGTIPVALALGIGGVPGIDAESSQIRAITFGVVLLSLCVQGLTIGPLLRALKLGKGSATNAAWERAQARALLLEAASDELATIARRGDVPATRLESLRTAITTAKREADRSLATVLYDHPELERTRDREIHRQLLLRQRTVLDEAQRSGAVGEHGADEARREIDALLARGAPAPFPGANDGAADLDEDGDRA